MTEKERRKAREMKYLSIASKLKQDAGVEHHFPLKWYSDPLPPGAGGFAETWHKFDGVPVGAIWAPEGKTLPQLFIVAHECGHCAHRHSLQIKGGMGEDRFDRTLFHSTREYEANKWAFDSLTRHGISLPKRMDIRWRIDVMNLCEEEKLEFTDLSSGIREFIEPLLRHGCKYNPHSDEPIWHTLEYVLFEKYGPVAHS
jgi:hypothetical protein